MGLTGRVLPLSGGQNLTQNCFIDLGRVDACAGERAGGRAGEVRREARTQAQAGTQMHAHSHTCAHKKRTRV